MVETVAQHIRATRKRGLIRDTEHKLMSLNQLLATKEYTQSSYIVAYDVITLMREVEECNNSKNRFVLAIPLIDNLRLPKKH